jgi:serine/threonine protein kinase
MSDEPSIRKVLFHAASSLCSPDERRVFLELVCRENPGLRGQLDKLLELQQAADTLFDVQPEVTPELEQEHPEAEGLGANIGRYRLIERIGEGGCGVVYLADQREPVRRKVAFKIIRLGMDTENVIARFEAERQALALMDHPNIARVFDAGATASGRPYFVMELVDGEKITEFCQETGLGLRERLELFVQVCQAIQHAHQKGVIHRDIKPSNVLVWSHDGMPVPKIIDFGIAKAATGGVGENATFTAIDQFLGTPAYMSPEQASGGVDVDTRSDIYSLGALLYELIADRPPFDAKRLKETGIEEMRRILCEEEPPPPSIAAGHRKVRDLDWIVMKAMAKERPRRYDTANGLAADVLRYLNDELVSARPPSRSYRLGKLVKRNKGIFAAVSIAVFGLLGGLGAATWLFLREKSALEEQTRLHDIAERARANEISLREGAEFREQVAQAAVQLGRGNLEEADRLLGSIPQDRVPASLEAANCYRKIAEWHVLTNRLGPAADRLMAAVQALSNVDDSDSDVISFDLLPASAAVCLTGTPADYEKIRELAIRRFGATRNPQEAEQVLKATLIKPADERFVKKLDPLARLVSRALEEPEGGWNASNPYLAAWSNFALGLKSFREGDDGRAKDLLNTCLSIPQQIEPRTASAHFVLAMIERRNGNYGMARNLIEAKREPVEMAYQRSFSLSGPYEGFWFDWIIAKLLLDEALSVID